MNHQRHSRLRLAALGVLAVALIVSGPLALPSVSTAAAQVTPLEDEPEEAPNLGRITGSPDPGPAPDDAGDRGGLIQLGLAIVLFCGLLFIATRIRAEVTKNRARHRPSDR